MIVDQTDDGFELDVGEVSFHIDAPRGFTGAKNETITVFGRVAKEFPEDRVISFLGAIRKNGREMIYDATGRDQFAPGYFPTPFKTSDTASIALTG